MSRLYRANVMIENSNPDRETEIATSLMEFWGFEDVIAGDNELASDADGYLTGGMSEEEFARELTQCVWKANLGFCEVFVTMTYLEELPCENYVFDSQNEYAEWHKTSGDGGSVS